MIKSKKGITLVALVITIAVMLIISSITITTSYDRFEINNLKKMQNDIELLNDKISNYYLKYNALPIVYNSENVPITYTATELNFKKNANDNGVYYIVDLSAMDGITLNYGQKGFTNPKSSNDVYIINEKSHHIYYIKGVELDGNTYHTINLSESNFIDRIPPTEPKINIVNGKEIKLGNTQYYFNSVTVEFVPGINSIGNNFTTTYRINNGEEIDIITLNNNMCEIENSGINKITLTTTNVDNGEINKKDVTLNIIKIGDYVDYDAGNHTHTPDIEKGAGTAKVSGNRNDGFILETEELKTEELNWRVIGINNSGQLELISETPTSQKLFLANDEGYVNAKDNLNNFCNDLYGQGDYAESARSLDAEYINKLTNYDPKKDSSISDTYGVEWTYKFPTQEEMDELTGTENSTRYIITSIDGGKTWNAKNRFTTFRLPDETIVLNEENVGTEKKVTDFNYNYYLSAELTTDDGYTSEIITELINMLKDDTNVQWLASNSAMCDYGYVFFMVKLLEGENIFEDVICTSDDSFENWGCYVRPIVTINSGVKVVMNSSENSDTNMWTLSIE